MSNVTRFEQTCLEEANGDVRLALTLASQKAIAFWNAMSPGYVRENPKKAPAIPPKAPLKEPVLLESERAGDTEAAGG